MIVPTKRHRLDKWGNKEQTSTHERQQFKELAKMVAFLEKKGLPEIRASISRQSENTTFIAIPVQMGTELNTNDPFVLLSYLATNYHVLAWKYPEIRSLWAKSRALRKQVIRYCMLLRLHRRNPKPPTEHYRVYLGTEFFMGFKHKFKDAKPNSRQPKPPTNSGMGELPNSSRSRPNGTGLFYPA